MGVQLASKLDPAAEAERLAQWAASYQHVGAAHERDADRHR
jgi:NADPH-dependent 7-cyano-7-deazaguanine reductase QueF